MKKIITYIFSFFKNNKISENYNYDDFDWSNVEFNKKENKMEINLESITIPAVSSEELEKMNIDQKIELLKITINICKDQLNIEYYFNFLKKLIEGV